MLFCQKHVPDTVQQILILCHGYGADGLDLTYGMEEIYQRFPSLACFYPNALNPTPFGGYEWFSLDDFSPEKFTNITYLETLIKRATPGISALQELAKTLMIEFHLSANSLFLGGFSQGALVALGAALSYDKKIAGVLSLSGVPLVFKKAFPVEKICQKLPILMTHGEEDSVISEKAWHLGKTELESAHQQVSAFSVPHLAHGINATVLHYMAAFIQAHS